MEEAKHFIGNHGWRRQATRQFPFFDPSDGQIFAQLARGNAAISNAPSRQRGTRTRARGATQALRIADACCSGYR